MANADQIADSLEAAISQACAALCLEISAELTEACPVDTGHARRNFVPSIGTPHDGEDDGAAQARGQAEVATQYRVDLGDLYVTNCVPYIGPLIMGSSTQAVPGWDLRAVDQAVQTIQDRYGATIDVSAAGSSLSARGFGAAHNIASAYSPFGE